jgi:hypothetical protein
MVLLGVVGCRDSPFGHRLAEGPLLTKPALPACVMAVDTFCGVESNGLLADTRHGFTSFHTIGSAFPADKHPRSTGGRGDVR